MAGPSLFVRGGGANRQGEIPNPALLPERRRTGDLGGRCVGDHAAPRQAGARQQPGGVGDTARSCISSAARCGDTTITGAGQARVRCSPMRGQARDLRWSPDGAQPGLCQRPRRSQLHRCLRLAPRSRFAISTRASISTPTRPGRRTARASCSRASPATGEIFMFAPRREACPGRFASSMSQPAAARESGRRSTAPGSVFQGVTAPRAAAVDCRRSPRLSVGARRLDSPVCGARRPVARATC